MREIVQERHPGGQLEIKSEALEAIQESTDQFLTELFIGKLLSSLSQLSVTLLWQFVMNLGLIIHAGAQRMANHAKRVTLQARDPHTLGDILRSFCDPGYNTTSFVRPTASRGSSPLLSAQNTLPPSAGPKMAESILERPLDGRALGRLFQLQSTIAKDQMVLTPLATRMVERMTVVNLSVAKANLGKPLEARAQLRPFYYQLEMTKDLIILALLMLRMVRGW